MSVTLENRLRQMQVFNLVHDAYCQAGECACSRITSTVVDENPRTGERAPRHVSKKAPGSLTLLAGEVRAGLPLTVLQVPDVRGAIARGHLRVIQQMPEAGTRLGPSVESASVPRETEPPLHDETGPTTEPAGRRTGRRA